MTTSGTASFVEAESANSDSKVLFGTHTASEGMIVFTSPTKYELEIVNLSFGRVSAPPVIEIGLDCNLPLPIETMSLIDVTDELE